MTENQPAPFAPGDAVRIRPDWLTGTLIVPDPDSNEAVWADRRLAYVSGDPDEGTSVVTFTATPGGAIDAREVATAALEAWTEPEVEPEADPVPLRYGQAVRVRAEHLHLHAHDDALTGHLSYRYPSRFDGEGARESVVVVPGGGRRRLPTAHLEAIPAPSPAEPTVAAFRAGDAVRLRQGFRFRYGRLWGLMGPLVFVGHHDATTAIVHPLGQDTPQAVPVAYLERPTDDPDPEVPSERVRWNPAIFPGMAAPLTRLATNPDGTVRVRGPVGDDVVATARSLVPARVLVSLTEAEYDALNRVVWRGVHDERGTAAPGWHDAMRLRAALADRDDTCQTCARHHTEPHVTGCPGDVSDRETGEQL